MNRRIESAYNYLDYRLMLNDDFLSRTTSNSSYSLRAYSRDLDVSPGFLSEVLRGQKELSLDTGKKLFSKLGFELEEMTYIENLINFKNSPNEGDRENAGEFIRKHHNYPELHDRPDKDGYLKSLEHFLIYGITRRVHLLEEIQGFAKPLEIAPSRVLEILTELTREGYIKFEHSQYTVTDLTLVIRTDDRVLSIAKNLNDLNLRLIKAKGGIAAPDRVVQGLVLGLDDETYEAAVVAHRHFIHHLNRLAASTKTVKHFAFVTHTFLNPSKSDPDPKKISSLEVEIRMKNLGLTEIDDTNPIKRLAALFKRFSTQAIDSPLYNYLTLQIADDEVILKNIPSDTTQPIPNLFLSAINYLLYQNPKSKLNKYYPNHLGQISLTETFYSTFKQYYFENKNQVHDIMQTRLVQTNEVRRCALLLPAVSIIATETKSPIALIDVGTSSGLNLLMDHYRIEYSNGTILGDTDSKLLLDCKIKGQFPENMLAPKIETRIGIDLNPLNLMNNDEKMWALSLIWPDQLNRIDRLKQALQIFSNFEVDLRKGSALDLIVPVIEEIPKSQTVCVMHSFVLNQFSPEARAEFETLLKEASLNRDVWRISLEWLGTEFSELVLEHFSLGKKVSQKKLADTHHHGEWLNWLT